MKRKVLMVCNTPYQILVATWLKMKVFPEDMVDIMISDHMNGSQTLVENAKKVPLFETVYHVCSKEMVKVFYRQTMMSVIHPFDQLAPYFVPDKRYDVLLAANLDTFTRMLFHAIANSPFDKRANKQLSFYLFEDGTSTYSKLLEMWYGQTKLSRRALFWYRQRKIYGNVSGIYVFDPGAMMWKPDAPVLQIPPIDRDNLSFKQAINAIFAYENMEDVYDKKYIFMEESFFAEGQETNDVEIVENIAKLVGKDNIMVKIHPRNPVNRFKKLGYKTNVNTAIPWEVILLNQDMHNKVLLSVSSTSIINPIRVFGVNMQAYSLYKAVTPVPAFLKGALWEAVSASFDKYYPTIRVLEKDYLAAFR